MTSLTQTSRKSQWHKPLQFACYAALGCLAGAAVGEAWLAVTKPAPPPPPPPVPIVEQAVVLVLDTSGSMAGQPLDEMKRAALGYIARQDLQHTRIAVVRFDTQAELKSPLTRDRATLDTAVNGLDEDGGVTRIDLGLGLSLIHI